MTSLERPAFCDLSESLYVPFRVRAFRAPKLLWVNPRWLAAIGAGSERGKRESVCAWLVERFAVGVPQYWDPEASYAGPWRTLYADRYGATQGSSQGGSGRVGTIGAFQVKGVGPTPLVSKRTDWFHSHGFMWLEEAIREAICSEQAAAEFPHGAVPTIAVIDTGERIHWNAESTGERRALLVRPAFLRLASLQRSIFFGDSGTRDSSQYADARRTADLWFHVVRSREKPTAHLTRLFEKLGEQYGAGQAMRLWPGPLYSSNVTLDGALVDFGGFRAMPSWRRARGSMRGHDFGAESEFAKIIARSIAGSARKHGVDVHPSELYAHFENGLKSGFEKALPLEDLKESGSKREATELLRRSFARQQADRTTIGDEDDGREWLADRDGGYGTLSGAARHERHQLEDLWQGCGEKRSRLDAFLLPKPQLVRERLLADCQALIAEMDGDGGPTLSKVTDFIEHRVARSGAGMPEQWNETAHLRSYAA